MKIKLNNTTNIDLDKLIDSRLLIQANSGGGKSFTIRRLIEQAFGKVQIIVLDPEGEFGNMRSKKFPFVYAGKDGDAPVESRSAALLARRFLELKASAIVDLYELPPQERKHFVRFFCEAMVNAPKELWHDVLVIIDEAHVFAPEKGESEALGPVIDLATRGRKRGYCVVLATQRLPKLNKDAAAECNNKLIGRASQDIDRKRASEELGFTSQKESLSLRDLEPGEFYAFGPAISREVQKITIGEVHVKPATRGSVRSVAAPSATVKKILSKLADLPQEAVTEERTIKGLTEALRIAQKRLRENESAPKTVTIPGPIMKGLTEKEVDARLRSVLHKRDLEWEKIVKGWERFAVKIHVALRDAATMANNLVVPPKLPPFTLTPSNLEIATVTLKNQHPQKGERMNFFGESVLDKTKLSNHIENTVMDGEITKMGAGERTVLIALGNSGDQGMTREHITVQTGYKRSTRDAYIQRLIQKGFAMIEGGRVYKTREGREALGDDYQPLPIGSDLLSHHLNKLPEGEAKILRLLNDPTFGPHVGSLTREEISEHTGFKRSTRDAYIQRLATRQLVVVEGQTIRISEHLL